MGHNNTYNGTLNKHLTGADFRWQLLDYFFLISAPKPIGKLFSF